MTTALNAGVCGFSESRQAVVLPHNKPKRLSKAGQWMQDNPGGIIVVLDRRAVNK